MTRYDPPDFGANDPTAYGNYGYGPGGGGYGPPTGGGYPPEPEPEPTPGWRKPLALVGWGVLIAVLIALIIYGIVLLARGRPSPATVTSTVTTVAPATTTRQPRRRPPPQQPRPPPHDDDDNNNDNHHDDALYNIDHHRDHDAVDDDRTAHHDARQFPGTRRDSQAAVADNVARDTHRHQSAAGPVTRSRPLRDG